MNTVTIRVLGPLEVEVNTQPVVLRRIEARMVSSLAWTPNAWVDHDTLSERVYFDAEPRNTTSWRNHLRRSLGVGSEIIETRRGRGTRLNTRGNVDCELDIDDFRNLRRRADEYLGSGEYDSALATYRRANSLWRGNTPFAEVADDVESYAAVAALRQERRLCQQSLVRLGIDAGDFAGVLPELRLMVETEPTDQATIAQLMRVSVAIGNPTIAGEYYDQLCRLLEDRGELPTAELIDLHGRILRDEIRPPPVEVPQVDVDLTKFVGRDSEVASIEAALLSSRLVTLVGPPGVGKSRLAREIARRRSTRVAVLMVQLASCRDGSDTAVRHHIADELKLEHRSGNRFIEDLAMRLAGQPTLLVLDNCEHIVESLIVVLAGLFSRLETVRVLATSRERLAIPGEILVRVEPLAMANDGAASDATSLCLDRVVAAGGAPYEETDLVEICGLLDGLPLAIELAAPTIAAAGIEATVERFRSDALLPSRPDPLDPRHRSLTSAIGSSFERLNAGERQVLFAAATFSTDVDVHDVSALTGHSADKAEEILMALTAKSLIRTSSEPGLYSLFETVRRFARLEGRRSERQIDYRSRHAARVRELAGAVESLHPRLLLESSVALRWAMEDEIDDGIATVDALRHELYRIDPPAGLSRWLLAQSERDNRSGLIATELWATMAFFQGNYADLHRRSERTLQRVQSLGEPHRLVRLHIVTAFSFALSGDYAQAADHAWRAEGLALETSDAWSYAWAASIDAYQLRRNERYPKAIERAVEALDRFEGLQYPQGKAFPFYTLAMAEYRGTGDAARGIELLTVGTRHAVAGSDVMLEGVGELFRGQVYAEQGDLVSASRSLVRTLECCLESPQWTLIVSGLEYSAVLLAADGDEETALALTAYSAMARWRNKLATQSRAVPYLPHAVAEPLIALPARPDPKYMRPEPMAATLKGAIAALSASPA